jgi:membrane protease YdiL (CAAX protease family)
LLVLVVALPLAIGGERLFLIVVLMTEESEIIASKTATKSISGQSKQVWFVLILLPLAIQLIWLVALAIWRLKSSEPFGVSGTATLVQRWAVVGTEIGGVIWVARWLHKRGRSLAELGLKTEWFGRELLLGVIVGFLLWVGGSAPLWILGFRDIAPLHMLLLTVRSPSRFVKVALIAFCEEVIWRGYAITELHRLYRLSISIIMAVLAFSLFYLSQAVHTHWLLVPWSLYLGGGLSLLYLWRRSLVAPMVAHLVVGCLSG